LPLLSAPGDLGPTTDADLVAEWPHSIALLGPWQYYHGYCVLVARTHVSELIHLPDAERIAYFEEMCALARAIERAVRPHKLNYELLGNQVPHLHWHLFPRSADDPHRLNPVWLDLERAKQDSAVEARLRTGPEPREQTIARLRRELRPAGR